MKSYKSGEGRAGIMGTLTHSSRDARQKPKELIAALEIKPGSTVVDLGTGAGYMLPYLSDAVGSNGKVIAQDIFQDFVDAAKKRAGDRKNIEYVLGTDKATKLPAGSADLILVLDVYHHFDYPDLMLADLGRALKPGGRLAIVEYHKNEHAMANRRALEHIRLADKDAIAEIESYGWKKTLHREFVPNVQWMAVFEKK